MQIDWIIFLYIQHFISYTKYREVHLVGKQLHTVVPLLLCIIYHLIHQWKGTNTGALLTRFYLGCGSFATEQQHWHDNVCGAGTNAPGVAGLIVFLNPYWSIIRQLLCWNTLYVNI